MRTFEITSVDSRPKIPVLLLCQWKAFKNDGQVSGSLGFKVKIFLPLVN